MINLLSSSPHWLLYLGAFGAHLRCSLLWVVMESTDFEFVYWCQVVYLVSYSCLKSINGREVQAGWVVPELSSRQRCVLLGRKAETQVLGVGALWVPKCLAPRRMLLPRKKLIIFVLCWIRWQKNHKWILPIQSIGWKEANPRQSKGMCFFGESCLNGKPFSKAHGRFSAMWQLWVKFWPCRTRELHQLSILRHVGLKIPDRGSSSCCLD